MGGNAAPLDGWAGAVGLVGIGGTENPWIALAGWAGAVGLAGIGEAATRWCAMTGLAVG